MMLGMTTSAVAEGAQREPGAVSEWILPADDLLVCTADPFDDFDDDDFDDEFDDDFEEEWDEELPGASEDLDEGDGDGSFDDDAEFDE